ncbi:Proline-serine-threonine phosphatase-interacting protein 1 [Nymphon striatum]|nr:Proline-serine-threonine phosphatase-interacting protein 1 [Nymphon striatum]
MKIKTETVGCMNIAMANSLLEDVNKTLEFSESQREQKKRVEDGVKKTHAHKKVSFKKTMELKKSYETKCREYETSLQAYSDSLANSSQKDLDKIQMKSAKLKAQVDQADDQYRSSIEYLEQLRITWEREMEAACEIFQKLEETRLKYLRNAYWEFLNLGSSLCVNEDDVIFESSITMYESIRKNMEGCDIDKDIEEFIKKSRTGSKRPEPILYECYQNNSNSNNSVIESTKSAQKLERTFSDEYSDFDDDSFVENDGTYEYVEVNNMYESGENEISLTEGAVVTLLSQDDDEWWGVENEKGEKGYFPANYLEMSN